MGSVRGSVLGAVGQGQVVTEPHPKPPSRAPKARQPLPRGERPKRKVRPKFGNAYTDPEWRKQVRRIRKRSRGVCEAQVCCGGNPVVGDPHHKSYLPMKGKGRLLVEDSELVDCCRDCHLWFENEKRRAA